MTKICTSLYEEINHRKPKPNQEAQWIFEDQEGLWRHSGFGTYQNIARDAVRSYNHHLQTRFGIIQVLP